MDRLTLYRSIPRFLWHESFILPLRDMSATQPCGDESPHGGPTGGKVRYDAIVSISCSDKRLWIPVSDYCHHVDPVAISHFREPRQYLPLLRAEKIVLQAVFPAKCQCQRPKRKSSRYLTGQMTSHHSVPPAGPLRPAAQSSKTWNARR